jgi:hypothetical protein
MRTIPTRLQSQRLWAIPRLDCICNALSLRDDGMEVIRDLTLATIPQVPEPIAPDREFELIPCSAGVLFRSSTYGAS